MSAGKQAKVFEFGPDNAFLASITAPSNGSEVSGIGVILFGMGMAEMLTARRLAKLGFPALQIRLVKDIDTFNSMDGRVAIYDSQGVSGCRLAMDELSKRFPVSRFIVMGNCAAANVTFNTALAEPRVTGMILTNPHVSELQTAGIAYKKKALRLKSWRRLLSGRSKAMGRLKTLLANRLQGRDEAALLNTLEFRNDTVLPVDFDRKLESISRSRGVRTLIVFAPTEPSLEYFKRTYMTVLNRLVGEGSLRFDITSQNSHVFSTDNDSARALNDLVLEWANAAFMGPESAPRTGGLPQNAASS